MYFNLSDAELILLWKNADDHAFEILYKRYALELLSVALKKTPNRDIAEEIVQDAFLCLFLKKATADTIVNLPGFLYTTVKNKIIDHYRREKSSRKYLEHRQLFSTETDNSTLQTIEFREMERNMAFTIEGLPDRCKSVFVLSRNHHLTNKQIATQLEISENTVEQHMRKALRILRSAIQRNGSIVTLLSFFSMMLH